MSTTHTKTGRRNKAMLKILELFSRRYHACALSLSDSQRVDPQALVRQKEDMFMNGVELSDRQDFPRSSRNLDRKNVLQRTKNTPAALVHGTISREPKLSFLQVQNFKEKGSASFPTVPRMLKTNFGS